MDFGPGDRLGKIRSPHTRVSSSRSICTGAEPMATAAATVGAGRGPLDAGCGERCRSAPMVGNAGRDRGPPGEAEGGAGAAPWDVAMGPAPAVAAGGPAPEG